MGDEEGAANSMHPWLGKRLGPGKRVALQSLASFFLGWKSLF